MLPLKDIQGDKWWKQQYAKQAPSPFLSLFTKAEQRNIYETITKEKRKAVVVHTHKKGRASIVIV